MVNYAQERRKKNQRNVLQLNYVSSCVEVLIAGGTHRVGRQESGGRQEGVVGGGSKECILQLLVLDGGKFQNEY